MSWSPRGAMRSKLVSRESMSRSMKLPCWMGGDSQKCPRGIRAGHGRSPPDGRRSAAETLSVSRHALRRAATPSAPPHDPAAPEECVGGGVGGKDQLDAELVERDVEW